MKLKHKFSIVALALASFASIGNAKAEWEVHHMTTDDNVKICALTETSLDGSTDLQFTMIKNEFGVYLFEPNPQYVWPYIHYNDYSGAADVDAYTNKDGVKIAQYSFKSFEHDKRLLRVFFKGGLIQVNDAVYDANGFSEAYKELVKCNTTK